MQGDLERSRQTIIGQCHRVKELQEEAKELVRRQRAEAEERKRKQDAGSERCGLYELCFPSIRCTAESGKGAA